MPRSYARGLRVAEPLAAALGVAVSDIEIIGYGAAWPCRVPDRDGAGRLMTEAAAANRVVVVSRGSQPGVF